MVLSDIVELYLHSIERKRVTTDHREDLSKSLRVEKKTEKRNIEMGFGIVIWRFEWIGGSHRTHSLRSKRMMSRDSIYCSSRFEIYKMLAWFFSLLDLIWFSNSFTSPPSISLFTLCAVCVYRRLLDNMLCLCKCFWINAILVAFRYCLVGLFVCSVVYFNSAQHIHFGKIFLLSSSFGRLEWSFSLSLLLLSLPRSVLLCSVQKLIANSKSCIGGSIDKAILHWSWILTA